MSLIHKNALHKGVSGLVAGVLVLSSVIFSTIPAQAAPITGQVFQDFNMNGVINTTGDSVNPAVDVGVLGVTVTGYSGDSVLCGTTLTALDGTYSLAGCTGPTRIQISNLPDGIVPSRAGANSSSTVQFSFDGASNVNFAVNYLEDFSNATPKVFSTNFDSSPINQTLVETDYD